MKELGLDYQSLYPINPQLIMTSITPFGQTGPHRDYKAYHLNTFHAGGGAYVLSALSSQPPVKGGGGLGDYDSAISAAVATTAALYSRWATGEGQHVDISRQESSIALDRIENVAYANRDDAETKAHALARGPLGGLFPCSDGYIVISLLEDKQWQALIRLIGNPEWAEKYSDRDSINRHRDEIMVLISQWTKRHTKQEIYHKAQTLGCPAGPVNNAKDLIDSDQLKARGFFVEITHPEAGTLKYPSAPYRFSKTPWAVERPAPLLGQHNKEIFGQLGYSDSELVQLREARVI